MRHEIVHEWVQAAVQARQAERDRVPSLNQVPDGTVTKKIGFCQEVQGHGDMVRSKAH